VEWIDPSARVSLIERIIDAKLAGTLMSELEEPGRMRIAAVGRIGVAQVPRPDLVAQEGDVLYLTVASEAMGDVDKLLAGGAGKGGH
jgi:trk/ktr system potassium uptake protein